MIQTVFAWLLMIGVFCAVYPWAAWLAGKTSPPTPSPLGEGEKDLKSSSQSSILIALCLMLAISTGALTLVMLWMGLLRLPLTAGTITGVYALVMLPGWVLWWRHRPHPLPVHGLPMGLSRMEWDEIQNSHHPRHLLSPQPSVLSPFLLLVILCLTVLFNAVYWPFFREDTLGIYHPQAQYIAATGGLIPLMGRDSLYLAYPAMIPLAYAYTYLVSGWENEYLAKLIPTLLSLGCLPATYLLGRAMHNRLAGWAAAMILVLAPTFTRWASSGYVDLPMAFFYTMGALFAYRLWYSRSWLDALLAGVIIGLAAWTKNAALISVGLLGVWLVWLWLNRRISWQQMMVSAVGCALVAAPWYVRNLIEAQMLIPDTAWTDQARASVENLLIFILKPEIFGVSGWLIIAGLVLAVVRTGWKLHQYPAETLLLLWTVPFFAVWWIFASYDPRFLLLMLPLFAVFAGIGCARMWERIPDGWQRRVTVPLVIVIVLLSLPILWNTIEFKNELLQNPLMSHEQKIQIVRGGENP